ncbi:MAG TPA: glycosyltransferase family A protein [Candidatus Paceibacterota bacterium]|jgi:glycosyltransferase involved in cell wall biosynthesis|nr:glycosyltransferase family A protein [Candidatus Paceibacterota bacterium]
MKHISVAIPTYEMHGKGVEFLTHSFDMLTQQTFTDFDIVISDHSADDAIELLCKKYADKLDIHYFKNTEKRGNSSANINNAIQKSTGKLIKILFQDDYLYHSDSLKNITEAFDIEKDAWLATACTNTTDGVTFFRPFYPSYNDETILIKNTVSSPSVITIKNENPVLFDENLIWWMDTDYYKRCYLKFGIPKLVQDINIVNRLGAHQITNTLATEQRKQREYIYILKKYSTPHHIKLISLYKIRMYKRILKSIIKRFL